MQVCTRGNGINSLCCVYMTHNHKFMWLSVIGTELYKIISIGVTSTRQGEATASLFVDIAKS